MHIFYLKKDYFASAAIAFATRFFPVAGGPYSNTAPHGFRFPRTNEYFFQNNYIISTLVVTICPAILISIETNYEYTDKLSKSRD